MVFYSSFPSAYSLLSNPFLYLFLSRFILLSFSLHVLSLCFPHSPFHTTPFSLSFTSTCSPFTFSSFSILSVPLQVHLVLSFYHPSFHTYFLLSAPSVQHVAVKASRERRPKTKAFMNISRDPTTPRRKEIQTSFPAFSPFVLPFPPHQLSSSQYGLTLGGGGGGGRKEALSRGREE